jgi:hypothetical protein
MGGDAGLKLTHLGGVKTGSPCAYSREATAPVLLRPRLSRLD